MDTKGKKALVAGTGISGIAAAELLLSKGVDIALYEGNTDITEEQIRAKSECLKNVPIIRGDLKRDEIEQFSIAVLSPGIPLDLPIVGRMCEMGVEIWGEIELAYHFAKGKVIAVTGTNGKTTTTALTGKIMENYFPDVKVVGNIGVPYTSLAAQTTDETVTVAEISSFQLETVHEFCPQASAILNITPDHLNRHHTMENYIRIKESITKNQGEGQVCVLNYEDEKLRAFGRKLSGVKAFYFSSAHRLETGLYLEDGVIYLAKDGKQKPVIRTDELQLLGRHNYENVMAAVALSLAVGVPLPKIVEVLRTFQGVAHRIEYVAEIAGVRYYNDSKGTNPDAAIQGIRAMDRPTYLIGGGYDKQSDYGEWIDAFDGKVRKLVLIGETKDKIAAAAREKGFTDIVMCGTLEEAAAYCHRQAKEGEAVLLSPACASWDMFKSYEQRGDIFKKLVYGYGLPEGETK